MWIAISIVLVVLNIIQFVMYRRNKSKSTYGTLHLIPDDDGVGMYLEADQLLFEEVKKSSTITFRVSQK